MTLFTFVIKYLASFGKAFADIEYKKEPYQQPPPLTAATNTNPNAANTITIANAKINANTSKYATTTNINAVDSATATEPQWQQAHHRPAQRSAKN